MSKDLKTNPIIDASIEARSVPVANAWPWVADGFKVFWKNPLMWFVLLIIYLLIIVPLSLIPFVGGIAATLLAPVFSAGLMWGCKAVVENQDLEINHLFAGFKHNTQQLVLAGVLYMAGFLVITIIAAATIDKTVMDAIVGGQTITPEQASKVMLPLLFAMLLLMPLLMAYWFAPVLVGLNNMKAIDAMKLSFIASLRNALPMLVYSVIIIGLMVLAIIPFGLGLLVVIPTMMTSMYTSYEDIFVAKTAM